MSDPLSNQIGRNIRTALGESPLFATLVPAHLDELAQGSCYVIYQKGQAVFHAGDPANQLYVLLNGQVKISLSCRKGNERILELLEPGQSFGQAELFIPGNYVVSAFAVKPSCVLAIRRDSLFRAMAQDPRIARRVIELLARRQIETEADLVAQNTWSPGQRLLGHLLELAGPLRQTQGETTVTLETSKKLLASRFDMQPETLSRNLRDLSEAGLIVVERRRVRLRNDEIDRYLVANGDPTLADRDGLRHAPVPSDCVTGLAGHDSWSHCGWVNGAGRQRALSQRMAKSWLMLERGLLSRQSRTVLRQSVNLFDSRLRELRIRANDDDNAATCAELARLWTRYRRLLEASPTTGDADKLFGITEDVLEVADLLARGFARSEGTSKGQMVNLAGRGRMLTQRAAKLFLFKQLGIHTGKCRSRLDEANEEFLLTLQRLKTDTLAAPGLASRLDSSLDAWKLFQDTMSLCSTQEFPQVARKVFRISEDLLNRMDDIIEICVGLPGDGLPIRDYSFPGPAHMA